MKHAEQLIDRILFLEGTPEIARYDVIRVGTDVKEQLDNDLVLELKGVKHYNEAIALCTQLGTTAPARFSSRFSPSRKSTSDWAETPAVPHREGRYRELPERADGRPRPVGRESPW